ncbi:sugar-binding transcriptional regulator [Streptococcus merionis]|uniref:Transcriptional regulator, putative n=1 Tax=Streptococcus merionis TaxID=400065 RepID=A0A239SS05_9STRE|nr:sugar-binding transcriptional regulator [Streptococcus merionis]SNU87618.1 transcriptional regulator, putative [Streptococcus merionis]
MKDSKRREISKIAYLYYIEGLSQTQIAEEMGLYRTTVSRMLTQAKENGIVQIEIENFDPTLLKLEKVFKKQYGLKQVEIAPTVMGSSDDECELRVANLAAQFLRKNIHDKQTIGLAWGASIGRAVESLEPKYINDAVFVPVVGGPSRINSQYHINTLVYELAKKFHGRSIFVNAAVVQETRELAEGIFYSRYFEELRELWKSLDMVIVGVGGNLSYNKTQWRDLINEEDYKDLKLREAVGDCCCRFIDKDGKILKGLLDQRTIGLPLEDLRNIKQTVAIARGKAKVRAIRALIKKGYINTLISDQETLLAILKLDKVSFDLS